MPSFELLARNTKSLKDIACQETYWLQKTIYMDFLHITQGYIPSLYTFFYYMEVFMSLTHSTTYVKDEWRSSSQEDANPIGLDVHLATYGIQFSGPISFV